MRLFQYLHIKKSFFSVIIFWITSILRGGGIDNFHFLSLFSGKQNILDSTGDIYL